ncbi:hypothetical protein ACSS6W_000023 [Trichoderma asperelloides]
MVLQATPQQSATGTPAAIPTTLVTTTDSAGNVFTVTGEVLIYGNRPDSLLLKLQGKGLLGRIFLLGLGLG